MVRKSRPDGGGPVPKELTLEQQLEAVDRYAERAYTNVLKLVKANKHAIIAMLKEGVREGFPQYGDAAFHKSFDELTIDQLQEIRDAGVYGVAKLTQGWPN